MYVEIHDSAQKSRFSGIIYICKFTYIMPVNYCSNVLSMCFVLWSMSGYLPRFGAFSLFTKRFISQKRCMSSTKCCYFSACEGWAWKHTKCKMEGFYQMYVPCTTYNYLRWTVCVLSQQYDFMQVTISHALKSVFFSREGYACMKYNGCKLQTIYTQSKVSIKVFWLLMQESLWQ